MLSNFIEITFGMGVFPMNTSGGLHTFFYKQRFFQLSLSVA